VSAVRRLEPGDLAVVVGAAALPAALFIAAYDAEVFLVDHDLGAVEGAESRAVTEQLAGRFQALVVTFGSWFPDVAPSLVIIDPAALAAARARDRHALLAELQLRTRPGGVHVILPSPAPSEVIRSPPRRCRVSTAAGRSSGAAVLRRVPGSRPPNRSVRWTRR